MKIFSSYQKITTINRRFLLKYKKKIYSNEFILTIKQAAHIYTRHPENFEFIMNGLKPTLDNPSEIIEDKKYDGTLYYVRILKKQNQNIVVKMNINDDKEHPHNSIITSYIVNDKSLKRLRKRGPQIYKKYK